jgi:SAM-dependent methyltransferase
MDFGGRTTISPCNFPAAVPHFSLAPAANAAMTFAHKIRKALDRKTYLEGRFVRGLRDLPSAWRIWNERRVAEQIRRRKEDLTVENILSGIDAAALARLQGRKEDEENDRDFFWTKYLDVAKWVKLNIRYANELGLIVKPPRGVLDLGCGGGFFLAVCRRLGSPVLGMDLDKDIVLNEMISLFGLKRVTWRIRAYVKLPRLRRKFELITAFMVCFNFPPRGGYWGVKEWDFFLNDVSTHLLPRGRLLLSLNQQPDGKCYDETLQRYFESREGVVEGKRILFTTEGLKRTRAPLPVLPASAPVAVAG